MMISEIAEFVGVDDHRTVWSVVRNEDKDDLAEDKLYLNGEVGDIINIDALGPIRPVVVKREGVEVRIQWPEQSTEGENSEDEVEKQCTCLPCLDCIGARLSTNFPRYHPRVRPNIPPPSYTPAIERE